MILHDFSDGPPPGVPADALLREALVARLAQQGRLADPAIAAAMRAVPRHLFLPDASLERAYADEAVVTKWTSDHTPLSSASQPAMIAIMLEQLAVRPGMRVLEIGAGTGYNAALLAHLVGLSGHVTTIDIDQDIVTEARAHLLSAGVGSERVQVICGDGAAGVATNAPYDRIILTAGAWDVAPAWWEQLAEGGRLVLPLALHTVQLSVALERQGDLLRSASLRSCGFIRLRGIFAGPEQFFALDDAQHVKVLAEPPTPSPEQMAALLASSPRVVSLDPSAPVDGLRYALTFMEPHIVTLFATPPHPMLGQNALGILAPEGDSACFLALDPASRAPLTNVVEYGAATAGLALEHVMAQWHQLGKPTLDDWCLTLHPLSAENALPAGERSYWIEKAHWRAELRVAE